MRLNLSSAGYQQAHWQTQWKNHDSKQRVFAASLAVLITVFLSLQFNYRSSKKSGTEFLNRPFTVLMLQMIPAQRPKVEDQTPPKKSAINKLRLIPNPVRQTEKLSDSTAAFSTEITPAQTNEQAVTLLPINSKSIAKAYNDSKSEIQKMAEASGKELNTPGQTKYDRFQTAAEQAVIPDCLAPQEPGGIGLLAIPVIAFQAATGKCK
ncbi:MAG: hypothetical protein V4447_07755 [Pseudomonadota bacterium]